MKRETYVLHEVGFIRISDLLRIIPISKTAWYDGIREGRYPAPIKIGKRTSVWKTKDIHQLIEELGSSQ